MDSIYDDSDDLLWKNSLSPRHDVHLAHAPHEQLSRYAPYAGLILSIILVLLFLTKNYILEDILSLLPRFYGKSYTSLTSIPRRGFVNHHIGAACRIILMFLAGYPFLSVAFGRSILSDPVVRGGKTTMGDMLLISSQLLVAMYIFETIYRKKLSPVACLHHVGTILVAQSAVAISIYGHKDADFEFILCCVWGAFDVIGELLPNFAIILYRVYPDHHDFLYKLFLLTAITTFMSTTAETITTMYLFGSLWSKWELGFKIATPILHTAFSAAQIHGSRIFLDMALKQRKIIKELAATEDLERQKKDNEEHTDGESI